MFGAVIAARFVFDQEGAYRDHPCANIFPILLIENTKDAHLDASLKIFPIVRGKRRDRMNKTCGIMVDMDGLDKMTRHE